MNEKYSALFTPWKIGNVEIKNRIVQPSMGGTSLFGWLEPCHFDKEAAYHILNRAQNNVGLVLPGMQCVRDTMGGRWLYQNKKMFKDLASGCRSSTRPAPSCLFSCPPVWAVPWLSTRSWSRCSRTRPSAPWASPS